MKRIRTSPRKTPVQKRSKQMVDDILSGAIRVLKRQGGRHFTTVHVAEAVGISVGSLYQYFPNKDAILFEIQRLEWTETSRSTLDTLADMKMPPLDRLKRMIVQFFKSELEEADLRKAIAETGLVVEDTDDFRAIADRVFLAMLGLLEEILPHASHAQRRFLAQFLSLTVRSLAEKLTTQVHSPAEIQRWAQACTKMVVAFLRESSSGGPLMKA